MIHWTLLLAIMLSIRIFSFFGKSYFLSYGSLQVYNCGNFPIYRDSSCLNLWKFITMPTQSVMAHFQIPHCLSIEAWPVAQSLTIIKTISLLCKLLKSHLYMENVGSRYACPYVAIFNPWWFIFDLNFFAFKFKLHV